MVGRGVFWRNKQEHGRVNFLNEAWSGLALFSLLHAFCLGQRTSMPWTRCRSGHSAWYAHTWLSLLEDCEVDTRQPRPPLDSSTMPIVSPLSIATTSAPMLAHVERLIAAQQHTDQDQWAMMGLLGNVGCS
jgi:hypothetical protein